MAIKSGEKISASDVNNLGGGSQGTLSKMGSWFASEFLDDYEDGNRVFIGSDIYLPGGALSDVIIICDNLYVEYEGDDTSITNFSIMCNNTITVSNLFTIYRSKINTRSIVVNDSTHIHFSTFTVDYEMICNNGFASDYSFLNISTVRHNSSWFRIHQSYLTLSQFYEITNASKGEILDTTISSILIGDYMYSPSVGKYEIPNTCIGRVSEHMT